jgi:hypothetical protein
MSVLEALQRAVVLSIEPYQATKNRRSVSRQVKANSGL